MGSYNQRWGNPRTITSHDGPRSQTNYPGVRPTCQHSSHRLRHPEPTGRVGALPPAANAHTPQVPPKPIVTDSPSTNDRHLTPAVGEDEHALEGGRVLLDVEVLKRDMPPGVIITGSHRVGSGVLAENVNHRPSSSSSLRPTSPPPRASGSSRLLQGSAQISRNRHRAPTPVVVGHLHRPAGRDLATVLRVEDFVLVSEA